MIVCQYFLQGRCRFGQNCKFEHTYSNDDRGSRIVINAQQLHDVLSRITEEVMMAEKGGQWPLSCFAPLRGKPNFPGFEDVSPEELRWKTYQAKANGTWDQCLNEIKELYRNVERMRNRITMPTKETLTLLVNVLKSKKELSPLRGTTSPVTASPQPTSQNIFGSAQQSNQNVFASSTQQTSGQSIFGGAIQAAGQNVLGSPTNSQNIFGSAAQSTGGGNVLGTSAQPSGGQNIFGAAQSPTGLGNSSSTQGNIFGNSSFSGNVFGNSSQATGNIFGGSPSTGSVFGGSSQSIFPASTTQANVFSNASFQKQNIFGGGFSQNPFSNQTATTTQSIFSSPVTNSGSVFSSPPAQNVFSNFGQGTGQTASPVAFQNQSSPFSQTSVFQTSSPSQTQQNVFGQNENVFKTQNAFGGNVFAASGQNVESQKMNAMDTSVYSKMEELTEEEINAFKSTIFAFGKIPLKSPPQEFFIANSDL